MIHKRFFWKCFYNNAHVWLSKAGGVLNYGLNSILGLQKLSLNVFFPYQIYIHKVTYNFLGRKVVMRGKSLTSPNL